MKVNNRTEVVNIDGINNIIVCNFTNGNEEYVQQNNGYWHGTSHNGFDANTKINVKTQREMEEYVKTIFAIYDNFEINETTLILAI